MMGGGGVMWCCILYVWLWLVWRRRLVTRTTDAMLAVEADRYILGLAGLNYH
jgi:uncharacterized protein (TIGR03382 family)